MPTSTGLDSTLDLDGLHLDRLRLIDGDRLSALDLGATRTIRSHRSIGLNLNLGAGRVSSFGAASFLPPSSLPQPSAVSDSAKTVTASFFIIAFSPGLFAAEPLWRGILPKRLQK